MYRARLPCHSESANFFFSKIAKFDRKLFFSASPGRIFVQRFHYTYVMPRFEIKPCLNQNTHRWRITQVSPATSCKLLVNEYPIKKGRIRVNQYPVKNLMADHWKFCHKGNCSASCLMMRLAEWCRTVIQSDGIFHLHRTTIIDSFSCIPLFRQFYLSLINLKECVIQLI